MSVNKNVIAVTDGYIDSCGKEKLIGEIATDQTINLGSAVTNCMTNTGHNAFMLNENQIIYSYNYDTILGSITIVTTDEFLIKIIYGNEIVGERKETKLIRKIKNQIDEYLIEKRKEFDVPIMMIGTDFQIKVWNELMKIKYGECISYKELAERVKNKNYARAVGMANNKNPIPIIIPCHRVIGKDGKMIGYAGGIEIKTKLLEIESTKF